MMAVINLQLGPVEDEDEYRPRVLEVVVIDDGGELGAFDSDNYPSTIVDS